MSKLYQRELQKVQDQVDVIQSQFSSGLISELEKVEAILFILDEYKIKTLSHYKHLVTHNPITDESQPYSQVYLLDNVRRALLLVQYVHTNVKCYIEV